MMTDSMQGVSSVLLKFLNTPKRRYTIDEYMDPLRELGFDDETLYATVRQLSHDGLVVETGENGYYLELTDAGVKVAQVDMRGPFPKGETTVAIDSNVTMRLTVPFDEFRDGVLAFRSTLENLKGQKIESEDDLTQTTQRFEEARSGCSDYIRAHVSPDIGTDLSNAVRYENRYREQGVHPFHQRKKTIQDRITGVTSSIDYVLDVVQLSDPLMQARSFIEERSSMSVRAKSDFLLNKLYDLRKSSRYWDTNMIFEMNQVELNGYDEPREITKSLENHGLVEVIGNALGLGAKITTEGNHLVEEHMKSIQAKSGERRTADKSQVFIVHGHDELAKSETARFVHKLGFEPIILHEQASSGKTIIEKIEEYTNVGFGIVLYTPCDVGAVKGKEDNLRNRARQNVVFEHGYLIGKIGRQNVCALVKGDVETPNDISGVVYISMSGSWQLALAKELKSSGYAVDMNKVL